MMKFFFATVFTLHFAFLFAQPKSHLPAQQWVDSVFNSLPKEQRIAQLMIIRAHSNLGSKHVQEVTELISKYNVGGLCFFQGGPVRQANLTNLYQGITKTPLLITIDGEWGLGMRLDSVIAFPKQLMMGAVTDAELIYQFGRAVGEQCKRLGIQVNFAPDVDINNNPNNPVINDRSFGEDKYKVGLYGVKYMKGMQDVGVMACAKHFPGHGDVDVDSHYDLPVINKTSKQLDSLELYPFREMIKAGVGSVMVAHLYIPSIDSTPNQATSLSPKAVNGLLKNKLGYEGLTITDGLEMKGVTKYYPDGEASVQSLIAGNDLLCLPGNVAGSITKITDAIKAGKLSWDDINRKVKKVLLAKYNLGLNSVTPIATEGLVQDLNGHTIKINNQLAHNALTLLRNNNTDLFPLRVKKRVAYVGIGLSFDKLNTFSNRLKQDYGADVYTFNYLRDLGTVPMLVATLKEKYEAVIVGMHNYKRVPANNFGISYSSIQLANRLQDQLPCATFVFGNPYAIKNVSNAPTLIAAYADDDVAQNTAADLLQGKFTAKGKLPVTVSNDLHFGSGILYNYYFPLTTPEAVGLSSAKLDSIDFIANDAIKAHAAPGCVVFAAKDGKVAFHKAYGHTNYDSIEPVSLETIYDLASVTKISATTVSVMKLYEEGKLDLKKTLGDYLPVMRGSDKENLRIDKILLHQAGFVSWIPFYKETLDAAGKPLPNIYSAVKDETHEMRVAENLYIRNDWIDTMYKRIRDSKLGPADKYVYSDNDFILLGRIVQEITGKKLEDYVRETFYLPLNMMSTSFLPREHFPINTIAPTEAEKAFRQQLLRGDVHDPGAAMFGGVAGHAGLFSNAYDLAQLYQMLLNGGEMNGQRFLKKETIDFFTAYNSGISRRGLGFDKPGETNGDRSKPDSAAKFPYPTGSASPSTFGHTGFTGTCVWADPQTKLLYIFLSNRVTPEGGDNNKLLRMNVRSNVHETLYKAMQPKVETKVASR
jgi:beta-N-acetylhexosaminidase